jgi:hypothetical protein
MGSMFLKRVEVTSTRIRLLFLMQTATLPMRLAMRMVEEVRVISMSSQTPTYWVSLTLIQATVWH